MKFMLFWEDKVKPSRSLYSHGPETHFLYKASTERCGAVKFQISGVLFGYVYKGFYILLAQPCMMFPSLPA